ncbi:hypothetical protein ACEWY4_014062 [Coilia grayii]|uniref:Rho GTPase-activating protein 29 n=1 Tax=Coilia grayii TaxID=363190 RepID=A0ABD1JRA7_9TELE
MGDVDSTSNMVLGKSRSLSYDNLTSDAGEYSRGTEDATATVSDMDVSQLKNGRGVESALLYAKAWSKYTKDLLAWVDKRINLDIESAKSMAKMAESAKVLFSQQDYMPFREIYISAFKKDIEYSQLLLQTASALQTNRFIQPLLARRTELDKLRKELKEQWQREQKKMHDAEAAMKKAYQQQVQRREEYERARGASGRTEDEQASGGRQRDKRRRIEEEALLRTEEALEQYKACVAEAESRRAALTSTQTSILTQIRELLFQCDLTLKAVTVNLFQLQRAQTACLPAAQHSLSERARRYQPGQNYTHFLSSVPREQTHFKTRSYDLTRDDVDGDLRSGPRRRASGGDYPSAGGGGSDSESAGGSSESHSIDSPVASPVTMGRGLPRTPSTGTMSSADDLDVREQDTSMGDGLSESVNSSGPFQNAQMSKAAQTHRLRRLRAPTKCRECDGLVVFHGAECEECSLACHKKCLEALSIQCGHRKLQGRLALFGEDFSTVARGSPDGVPFIIRKCAAEVESRALTLKGIYRVNGAKSRVEKLCQAFENGKELVELSDHSPHDISNVLKLYLRQLPEPLIQHRFYNDVIGIAKETQKIVMVEAAAVEQGSSGQTLTMEVQRVVLKMRDLLHHLPSAQYRTLHFLLAHLYRVSEQEEDNKMSASNLGIIFGPTLVRAPQTGAEVSLSSLVDYPFQALAVELLIRYHQDILPLPLPLPTTSLPEQHLRRNSHCLLDIKEAQPNRGQHRYSCLGLEVQLSDGHEDTALLSPSRSSVEGQRLGGSNRSPVLLRPPISPPQLVPTRPISMPVCMSIPVPLSPLSNEPVTVPASPPVSQPVESQPQPTIPVVSGADVGTEAITSAAVGSTQTEPDAGLDPSTAASVGPGGDASWSSIAPDVQTDRATVMTTDTSPSATTGTNVPDSSTGTTEDTIISSAAAIQATQAQGTVLDTLALRRTWEKEYRPPLLTPRTAMILANLPRSAADANTAPAPFSITRDTSTTTSATSSSVSTMFPRSTYCVSVGHGGPPVAFRALRTLHPPSGTFYQPPQSPSRTVADTSPGTTPAPAPAISSTTTPTRQRLRSSLQELEPREAHFV